MLLIKVLFNVIYLAAAWILIFYMIRRKNIAGYKERFTIQCIFAAFFVLVAGDTFCSILSAICYTTDMNSWLIELTSGISGVLFITFLLFAFKYHFNCPFDFYQVFLLFISLVRLVTIIFPGEGLRISGSILFAVFGVGVAFLIMREAFARNDYVFIQAGIMLLVSMLCSIPEMFFFNSQVLTFVFTAAKTLANLSMGMIFLGGLFRKTGINMVRLR